ncbi:glutamate--tRNA ligase [Candidatus Saccharibacteria bacterium]|nr:glutamate--tRNA ligase [Candidatus Saccharibacteria bacterium]
MKEIRTRFAPSPTGYIHIGNVRSAIYPYLIAKQAGGVFYLRIEDTDQARYVEGAEDLIMDTLKWLGLKWDEGVDVGGPYAPYRQTERKEIYHAWAQKLVDKGLAYADPYTAEEVEVFREKSMAEKKAFLYRDYRPENPPKWDGTQPLRFKVTNIKRWNWHDEVMGDLTAGPEALDDFILIKSDGLPTYNFAHIVDDAEMRSSHITRGVEYVSSTPKYLSLYEALEIEPPILVSLPHIMAPSGNKKLGKRDGAKSATEYRDEGYLPEAMLNFLVMLGWNDGTEQEIFTMEELVERFDVSRVQRSGAKFDEQRLIWMNGQWIRRLSLDELYERCEGFWSEAAMVADEEYRKKVLRLVQDRLKTLGDLRTMVDYFFVEPEVNLELIDGDKRLKKYERTHLVKMLEVVRSRLESVEFEADKLQEVLNELLVELDEKPANLFSLVRVSLSWAPFSPALNEMMEVLGREKVLERIDRTIEALE